MTASQSRLPRCHGQDGAFPPPRTLARLDLDLPGRKGRLPARRAEAALDGLLDGAAPRALEPGQAIQRVQQVKGLDPFAAKLVVVRGANAPDALPRHERRLDAEITERYGPGRTLTQVSQAWRPYRTWAAVHLRAARAAHARDRRSHPGPSGHAQRPALSR
jgi:DNA-3-methyladenine glycosylase II